VVASIQFQTKLKGNGSSVSYIEIPKKIMTAFGGKKRVPVKASLNKFAYRTTICSMCGLFFIPVRREIRLGAKLEPGDLVKVHLKEDLEERKVSIPSDLLRALKGAKGCYERFSSLSYTNQKESVALVTSARKPETRTARIAKILGGLKGKLA
jgi:hypothetical protein